MLFDLQTKLQSDIENYTSNFNCVIMDEFQHLTYLIEKTYICICFN